MPMDCEVFEPNDENIAQLIVRILEEKGYNAGYQLGYPHNKVFIKVDVKEEADKISGIIRKFMKKFNLAERAMTTSKFNTLTSNLVSLIPEPPNRKLEQPAITTEKNAENIDIYHFEKSKNEVVGNVKFEELRSKISEKLNEINTLIAEHPKDRSNEKRRIERDTLVWVLQNMP